MISRAFEMDHFLQELLHFIELHNLQQHEAHQANNVPMTELCHFVEHILSQFALTIPVLAREHNILQSTLSVAKKALNKGKAPHADVTTEMITLVTGFPALLIGHRLLQIEYLIQCYQVYLHQWVQYAVNPQQNDINLQNLLTNSTYYQQRLAFELYQLEACLGTTVLTQMEDNSYLHQLTDNFNQLRELAISEQNLETQNQRDTSINRLMKQGTLLLSVKTIIETLGIPSDVQAIMHRRNQRAESKTTAEFLADYFLVRQQKEQQKATPMASSQYEALETYILSPYYKEAIKLCLDDIRPYVDALLKKLQEEMKTAEQFDAFYKAFLALMTLIERITGAHYEHNTDEGQLEKIFNFRNTKSALIGGIQYVLRLIITHKTARKIHNYKRSFQLEELIGVTTIGNEDPLVACFGEMLHNFIEEIKYIIQEHNDAEKTISLYNDTSERINFPLQSIHAILQNSYQKFCQELRTRFSPNRSLTKKRSNSMSLFGTPTSSSKAKSQSPVQPNLYVTEQLFNHPSIEVAKTSAPEFFQQFNS